MQTARRTSDRVAWRARVALSGAGLGSRRPAAAGDADRGRVAGQAENLSTAGIFVRSAEACAPGTEVVCHLPLPGGTRRVRGRVRRVQHLGDSTGLGIEFIDLTEQDRDTLRAAVDGGRGPAAGASVKFEGMPKPVQCRSHFYAGGARLRTRLGFLRTGSTVEVAYQVGDQQRRAVGKLARVALEPSSPDGVPRLAIDLDLPRSPFAGDAAPDRDAAGGGGGDGVPVAVASASVIVSEGLVREAARAIAGELQTPAPVPRPVPAVAARAPHRLVHLPPALWTPAALALVAGAAIVVTTLAPDRDAPPAPAAAVRSAAAATARTAPAQKPAAPSPSPSPSPAPSSSAGDARVLDDPLPDSIRHATGGGHARLRLARGPLPPPATTDSDTAPRPRPRPARPEAGFEVDRATGHYRLRDAVVVDLGGARLTGVASITAAPAANVRGIDVPVAPEATSAVVALPAAEADAAYGVQVAPSWPTATGITEKTAAGFTVTFGTPAPSGARLDWLLIR